MLSIVLSSGRLRFDERDNGKVGKRDGGRKEEEMGKEKEGKRKEQVERGEGRWRGEREGERQGKKRREGCNKLITYSPSGRAANLLLLRLSVMSCFNWYREGVSVVILLKETSSDVKDDSNDTSVP